MSKPNKIKTQLIDLSDIAAESYAADVIKNWDKDAEEQVFPCNKCGFSLKIQYKGKPKYWIGKSLLQYLIISTYLVIVKEDEVDLFTRAGQLIRKSHQELNLYADKGFSAFHRDHQSEVFVDHEVATFYTQGAMENNQFVAKSIVIASKDIYDERTVDYRFNFKLPNNENNAVFCSAYIWSMMAIQPNAEFYNILIASALTTIKDGYEFVINEELVEQPEDFPHVTFIHSYFMLDDTVRHGFVLRYSQSEDSEHKDRNGHRFYAGSQKRTASWHHPCGYVYLGDLVNLAEKNSLITKSTQLN